MSEVNYTKEMEAELTAMAPITYAMAVEYGEKNGKSTRSVIAKVKQLDLDYMPKVVPAAKPKGPTKAELVAEIAKRLGVEKGLDGLEKANASALLNLVDAV